MTCIVAVSDKTQVWMGADALATNGHLDKYKMSMPKVWERGEFVFGGAGSATMLQSLRATFVPDVSSYSDDYMYGHFVEQLREFTASTGQGSKLEFSNQMLIGFNGSIYKVMEDYFINKTQESYDSIGSGSPYALGSLTRTHGDPRKRITRALEAAVEHNAGCEGPFTLIHGGRKSH